mmetsp:Transcript_6418/g.12838  ORF Transcript_6418/g.12838 Transcript_6418/m.12838 type:complete len:247 (-) Transcript_6418:137-877(-)
MLRPRDYARHENHRPLPLVTRDNSAKLDSGGDYPNGLKKPEDLFDKAGKDHSSGVDDYEVVQLMHTVNEHGRSKTPSDENDRDMLQQCDLSQDGALQHDEFMLSSSSSTASLLEAGAATEESAAADEGDRCESPWAKVDADGSLAFEPHGAPPTTPLAPWPRPLVLRSKDADGLKDADSTATSKATPRPPPTLPTQRFRPLLCVAVDAAVRLALSICEIPHVAPQQAGCQNSKPRPARPLPSWLLG